MLFQVTHTTSYLYQTPVSHCLNEVRLTPRSFTGQKVLSSAIRVTPQPAFIYQRKDYYGNDVTSFEVLEKHDRLEASAESVIEVLPGPVESLPSIPWEEASELIAGQTDAPCIEASEFRYSSPFVPALPQLEAYARKVFAPGRPLLEGAKDLAHCIHGDFKYHPKSTSIDIPLADVVRGRRGVCQDFAHVMIGALRSLR